MTMYMQPIMRAAAEIGVQTCPTCGCDHPAVADGICLPNDYVIGPLMAIGRGTKDAWPKPGQSSIDQVAIHEGFSWN